MSSSTQHQTGGAVERLDAIHHALDLPEALSIFFDAVLSPQGVERALVLVLEKVAQ